MQSRNFSRQSHLASRSVRFSEPIPVGSDEHAMSARCQHHRRPVRIPRDPKRGAIAPRGPRPPATVPPVRPAHGQRLPAAPRARRSSGKRATGAFLIPHHPSGGAGASHPPGQAPLVPDPPGLPIAPWPSLALRPIGPGNAPLGRSLSARQFGAGCTVLESAGRVRPRLQTHAKTLKSGQRKISTL